MQNLFDKLSKRGKLVVDMFFGILATVEACLELLQHRDFLSCKVDAECFPESEEVLAETYARQALNGKSDNSGIDEMMDECKIIV